jgi:hypothetical protein
MRSSENSFKSAEIVAGFYGTAVLRDGTRASLWNPMESGEMVLKNDSSEE